MEWGLGYEKQMRSQPLERNFPSLSYIVSNWPKTKPLLRKFALSKQLKPNLFKICYLCLRELKVFKDKKIILFLKKAAAMCLVNKTYNSYHDSHHFKTVVVIACMIAMSERLSERDGALLIIVALCHDFDHQGRRIISRPYYQEEISFQKFRRLFHKSIFRTSEINRIHKIFRNTYFPFKTN